MPKMRGSVFPLTLSILWQAVCEQLDLNKPTTQRFLSQELCRVAVYCTTIILIWTVLRVDLQMYYFEVVNGCVLLALFASTAFVVRAVIPAFVVSIILVGVYTALKIVNELKISAVTYPLTLLDFRMFLLDPRGLLLSLGAPKTAYIIFNCALILFAACVMYFLFRCVHRALLMNAVGIARAAVALTVLLLLIPQILHSTQRFMNANQSVLKLWEDDGLVRFSRAVGVVPFLMYSGLVENQERNYFFDYEPAELPPSEAVIQNSVAKFLIPDRIHPGALPNIIIIHAESTFDPNDVFNLASPAQNALFYANQKRSRRPQDHFHGPLLANTIGGGSWISEFEVLLGVDSRLFGVAGQYTHASLSAYSRKTFPRYLISRGYHVSGYTIEDGSFYNARRAYYSYGFQDYYASSELGFTTIDLEIMGRALAVPAENPTAPFLKFVLLHENHSPHACEGQETMNEAVFGGQASASQNCILNEYLRRAHSTERAVAMAETFLQREEKRTGRPYVIAVYGDHQPHSFTATGGQKYSMGIDVTAFRKDLTKRKTVFQLISSKSNPLRCCWTQPIPMTLLPTLVSAYVASSSSEVYLPQSLYQLDKCGPDWIGRLVEANFYLQESKSATKAQCGLFESLLAAYKQSNVLGNGNEFVKQATAAATIQRDEIGLPVCSAKITVTASGTSFRGPPTMKVYLDGELVGERVLDNAPDNSFAPIADQVIIASARPYEFSASVDHHPSLLEVEFVNDNWAGPTDSGDTNLWISSVKVEESTFKATDLMIDAKLVKAEKKKDWVVMWSSGRVSLPLREGSVEHCL